MKTDGTLAYSVFQQGAGLVNIYDAVYAEFDSGRANLRKRHGLAMSERRVKYWTRGLFMG